MEYSTSTKDDTLSSSVREEQLLVTFPLLLRRLIVILSLQFHFGPIRNSMSILYDAQ